MLFFLGALLYSSVGHGGGSAYLAAMALMGVEPARMKPMALTLNIVVSGIGVARFWQAGRLPWAQLAPFVVAAAPCAFIGGSLTLPGHVYRPIVGVALWVSAARLIQTARRSSEEQAHRAPLWAALFSGAIIGLLSGLTGVGGGIFLSPLLLLMHWATARDTAGMSAGFILLNSIAGLAGSLISAGTLPQATPLWIAAVAIGGLIGAELGSRRLAPSWLRILLGVVLFIAGAKLALFT